MPEENQNLEGDIGAVDFNDDSMLNIEDTDIMNQNFQTDSSQNIENFDMNDNMGISSDGNDNSDTSNFDNLELDGIQSGSSSVDSNLFLDSGEDSKIISHTTIDGDGIGKYLRLFFFAGTIAIIGVLALVLFFSFDTFISNASQTNIDEEYVSYVGKYKEYLGKAKDLIGINNVGNYTTPSVTDKDAKSKVNEIINATDIDYIEKKDLLTPFVTELVNNSESAAFQIENIKKEIARQGFLPEEIDNILSEEQGIDTIQRSLNALEVIKFSTATRVFSYMDSAITTITEMIRLAEASNESISNLLNQVNLRGEKDISAYVYMCYLNPFEINASCDVIGDFDLYYNSIIKDDSLNIRLFKNTMNAMNQLLEKNDSALFSITFDGFNAESDNISFSIEVSTNQNDERSLIAKGQKTPNIFILKNIINLLKQSSFIIGESISTKEVSVETKIITVGGISTKVNYSSLNFLVPIQRTTEREIFDYIDIDKLQKILNSLNDNGNNNEEATETDDNTNDVELNNNESTTSD